MTTKKELRALKALSEKVDKIATGGDVQRTDSAAVTELVGQIFALRDAVAQANEKLDALLQAQAKKAK